MTLYGDAKKAYPSKAGIYHLAPMMVNGKSYWVHASGEHAIWFSPKAKGLWIIGEIADAGTTQMAICTYDAVSVPQKASVWKYYKNAKCQWTSGQGLISVSLQN